MKFTVAEQHREYFQQNHYIEFEELLPSGDFLRLKHAIEGALSERVGVSREKVLRQPATTLFESGRDLWRTSDEVREVSCQRNLGEIASLLTDEKPLRLGYDQFFPAFKPSVFRDQSAYWQWMKTKATLKEISCLQGVVCGVLFCLSESNSFGNVIFLGPEAEMDFIEDLNVHENSYYLIVYTRAKSVYLCNKSDSHHRDLLKWKYNFGDRLTDKSNPIIFR